MKQSAPASLWTKHHMSWHKTKNIISRKGREKLFVDQGCVGDHIEKCEWPILVLGQAGHNDQPREKIFWNIAVKMSFIV